MSKENDLTQGSVPGTLIRFALPYLLSCFLQTFYGMADLFVVGLYNGKEVTAAVSTGSQVTHMLTVIIVGMAMGITVHIGTAAGAKNTSQAKRIFGTACVFFAAASAVLTVITLLLVRNITSWMLTPQESVSETIRYLIVCFCGIPFIAVFNAVTALFRGFGDSRRPMYFVAAACVVNILLDFLFVGDFHMGAAGAGLATVFGQAVSAAAALAVYFRSDSVSKLERRDLKIDGGALKKILGVGIPVALQDGLIQIAFTIIIVIANSRGLVFSTSVGIVEKIIGFMFLVPSSFLSAISAVTAQNMGAGKPQRAKQSLWYGMAITVFWGIICCLVSNLTPETLISVFTKDSAVVEAGSLYLRSYAFDCIFAAVHFCFSGYFCGSKRSVISFIHNIVSIIIVRIPGAMITSRLFPDTLYPMGWAAPIGSILSALICVGFYVYLNYSYKKNRTENLKL